MRCARLARRDAGRLAREARGIEAQARSCRHSLLALVQVANERRAGVLVLGPKRGRVSSWRLRRAAQEVRRNAACLVWVAGSWL